MRVGGKATTEPTGAVDLEAEPVQVRLGQPALDEGPGVDARRSMALHVDVVARFRCRVLGGAVAPEEVVEAHLVERSRTGEGRQMATDGVGALVGPHDHRRRVPADESTDAAFEVLVAGEPRLPVDRDRVDVGGADRRRGPDRPLPGPFEEPGHQVAGPDLAALVDHRVERVEPLLGLFGVDVGELVGEPVDDHRAHLVSGEEPGPAYGPPARRVGACRHRLALSASTPTAPVAGTPVPAGGPGPSTADRGHRATTPTPPTSAWRSVPCSKRYVTSTVRWSSCRTRPTSSTAGGTGGGRAGSPAAGRTPRRSRWPTATCGNRWSRCSGTGPTSRWSGSRDTQVTR